jgi:VanZ family protein
VQPRLQDRVARVALPVYWALLAVATHYPRVRIPGEIPHSDKLVHFTAFGLLALLWWMFFRARGPRFVWTSAAILIPYAAVDEYTQQYFGRYTDLMDFIANTAGVVVVLAAVELRRRSVERAQAANIAEP